MNAHGLNAFEVDAHVVRSGKYAWAWAVVIGAAAFAVLLPLQVLAPSNVQWLLDGDPAQHWLGWAFYRNSPLVQWPLGRNFDFGMGLGGSLVFSDSIPLLAIPLKYLIYWYDGAIQYTGLWLLGCLVLQSFFALKLIQAATGDFWFAAAASLLFVFSPIMVSRLHGHYGLVGHWILLAALFLYVQASSPSRWAWPALLSCAALVHFYLLVLAFAMFAADTVQRSYCLHQMNFRRANAHAGLALLAIAISMWAAGYFGAGGGYAASGFGLYGTDVVALIDPGPHWSHVLPDLGSSHGAGEGFNYFGIGGLLIICIAAAGAVRKRARVRFRFIPLMLACSGLACYAMWDGDNFSAVTVPFPLSALVELVTGTLRASGRLFWPAYYLVLSAALVVVRAVLPRTLAIGLPIVAVALQLVDASAGYRGPSVAIAQRAAAGQSMRSETWSTIGSAHSSLVYVLPENLSEDWIPLAKFASTHRLAINTGYFARVNAENVRERRVRLTKRMLSRTFDPESIYVFGSDLLWRYVVSVPRDGTAVFELDGYRLLIPRPSLAMGKLLPQAASISLPEPIQEGYGPLQISFSDAASSRRHLVAGWSNPEPWGTWSLGRESVLLVSRPAGDHFQHCFEMQLIPFLDASGRQEAKFTTRSSSPVSRTFTNGEAQSVSVPIRWNVEDSTEVAAIGIAVGNPTSPSDRGLSSDKRQLGVGLVSASLTKGECL